jgi:predicted signal transduction protein with EAL and GGDEF domain
MFQFDTRRAVTFTNDRLHMILGLSDAATMAAQFSLVDRADRPLFNAAVNAVLADEAVDDVELRFLRPADDAPSEQRVCVVSMRPLTDRDGGVTGAVGCVSDVTDQVELRRQLELRANTDELTSCLNRSGILAVLSTTLDPRSDTPGGTAVIFVDLCAFKVVNDMFGHAAGDHVLVTAANRLRAVIREDDRVGRFGGDEFLVVCPGLDKASTALEVA